MRHFAEIAISVAVLAAVAHTAVGFATTRSPSNAATSSFSRQPTRQQSSSTTALFTADSPYMRTTFIPDELVERFQTLRKAFPENADVVSAGGWYNLERLSVDPKQEFVGMITEGLKSTDDAQIQFGSMYEKRDTEKLEALLLLLYGMGKGFESDAIDGEWDLVFTRQGKKSPSFQKFVGNKETAGLSKNFFDVASMTFTGLVKFWRGLGKVATKAKV